jgi:hypothetical protein
MLLLIAAGTLSSTSFGQSPRRNAKTLTLPAELTPADPEIRLMLGVDDTPCKAPNVNERVETLRKAMEIAEARGLIGDRAVIEEALASTRLAQGNAEEAFLLFQKALQDSIDARRPILQADILISLTSESLGGQFKSGQVGSVQNRTTEVARNC